MGPIRLIVLLALPWSLLQVHPLEGEAVQVRRVWQGVLPVPDPGRAQDPTHGRVPPQVSGVQSQFQPALQPQDPPANPHRHQTLQLFRLRQSVQTQLRPTASQPYTQLGGGVHLNRDARHVWLVPCVSEL